eukprot:TRINITY_DN707_c0_g1_i3.p1 TRINITY_DN707_c0_g1~~TRINITY_DN707_c0_g1_i3.p1  ORF type:complete len:198 (+),score=43.09 TRINITY_DN707_c0_g1_i3:87-596(+)
MTTTARQESLLNLKAKLGTPVPSSPTKSRRISEGYPSDFDDSLVERTLSPMKHLLEGTPSKLKRNKEMENLRRELQREMEAQKAAFSKTLAERKTKLSQYKKLCTDLSNDIIKLRSEVAKQNDELKTLREENKALKEKKTDKESEMEKELERIRRVQALRFSALSSQYF